MLLMRGGGVINVKLWVKNYVTVRERTRYPTCQKLTRYHWATVSHLCLTILPQYKWKVSTFNRWEEITHHIAPPPQSQTTGDDLGQSKRRRGSPVIGVLWAMSRAMPSGMQNDHPGGGITNGQLCGAAVLMTTVCCSVRPFGFWPQYGRPVISVRGIMDVKLQLNSCDQRVQYNPVLLHNFALRIILHLWGHDTPTSTA